MADTQYSVSVNYSVNAGQSASKVDGLSRSFSGLSDLAGGITRRIDSAVSSIMHIGIAAVTAAGAAGIGALVHGVTRLNAEAEAATIGIAGMIQSGNGAENFSQAMSMSQSVIAAMRRDASALPGEFEDLQRIFQGGLMGGLNAGKSVEDIEKFSGRMMAVSKMLNIDSHTAGRELSMLMEGRAGAHVVLFSRLRTQIGMTAREFNEATPQQRFEALSRSLNGFDPAIREFSGSWDAISSTTMDILKNTLRIASGPLFTRVKTELNDINNFLQAHQDRVNEIATTVGQRLASAFDRVKDSVLFIRDHFREISEHARGLGERFGGAALVGRGALGLMANTGVAGAVGGMLGGGVGTGGIAIAAVFAPLIVAIADGSVSLRRLKADVDSVLTPLVHGLGQMWNVLQPVISALGQLQFRALETLLDNVQKVASAFDGIATSLNEMKDLLPQRFLNTVGTFWDAFTDMVARGFDIALHAIPGVGALLTGIDLYHQYRAGRSGMSGRAMADEEDQRVDAISPFVQHALARREDRRREQQVPSRGNMRVDVRIVQTINDAADSDRVLVDTRRAIWSALRHPIESAGPAVNSAVLR